MSLLRFVGSSKDEFLRKNPEDQLEMFENKIHERNFVEPNSIKYDVKPTLLIGVLLGSLLYLSTKNLNTGVSKNV